MKQTKDWVLAATRTLVIAMVLCGASVFTACSLHDDNPVVPEKPLSEMLIGKWMVSELDGQPCPTNLKTVITFLSPTVAYGSISDFYSDSWNDHAVATVTIDGSKVSLTANEDEHITHVTNVDITRITDTDMWLSSDWRVYRDGVEIGGEVWGSERYERITDDYEDDIIGTWEGKVTSEEDDHSDGEIHRWEYRADGTFVYYNKVDGDWQSNGDVLNEYFVDGTLLCTRWKATPDSEENREWWEIESIRNGKMKWKALRLRDDLSTYVATFEMTKVE